MPTANPTPNIIYTIGLTDAFPLSSTGVTPYTLNAISMNSLSTPYIIYLDIINELPEI